MVFCNMEYDFNIISEGVSHNPYFNRWFSAICSQTMDLLSKKSHNPYFNRWFSAIKK